MQIRNPVWALLFAALGAAGCNHAGAPADAQGLAGVPPKTGVAQDDPLGIAADAWLVEQEEGRSYDQVIADAEGIHRLALASCETLAHRHEQRACKDRADDDLSATKARAEALLTHT
jgi:hypothetical protein